MSRIDKRGWRLRTINRIAVVAVLATSLASCGGDDDNDSNTGSGTTDNNQPPTTASESVEGFIAFLKVLVPTKPDTTQPLDVTGFVAPTTETGLPDPTV